MSFPKTRGEGDAKIAHGQRLLDQRNAEKRAASKPVNVDDAYRAKARSGGVKANAFDEVAGRRTV